MLFLEDRRGPIIKHLRGLLPKFLTPDSSDKPSTGSTDRPIYRRSYKSYRYSNIRPQYREY